MAKTPIAPLAYDSAPTGIDPTSTAAYVVSLELVPLPEMRAADRGVPQSLESVLSGNTRRVYTTQWRTFEGWCDEVLADFPVLFDGQPLPDVPGTPAVSGSTMLKCFSPNPPKR